MSYFAEEGMMGKWMHEDSETAETRRISQKEV
jgi:hypothetical protein